MKIKDNDNYKIIPASEMKGEELSNWFAFCNALKFFTVFCKKKGINPDSIELDSREVSKYVEVTAGDILTNLREHGGIPLKYSLDMQSEESKDITEVQYA